MEVSLTMANQHRVLIIGAGSIGERHLRCFQTTGRADVAVCELNAELRGEVAKRYGNVPAFDSLDSALEEKYSAAVVAVPAHLHVPMSTTLAGKGIHILCEKPLSTSLTGIDELQKAVQQSAVTFVVGYTWRCNALMESFKAALDRGDYGKPLQVTFNCGSHWPHYRPAYNVIPYFQKRESGGGVIQDGLTHMTNLAEWLFGPITKLTADHAHLLLDGITMEDTVHLIARHGDILANYSFNLTQMPAEIGFTIVTDKGTLRIEAHNNRWRWMTSPDGDWQDTTFPDSERDTNYIKQANAFLDAIEGKGAARCSLQEGIQTLKVNLAALEAADNHNWQIIED
jgi:predicted dehydrogenase